MRRSAGRRRGGARAVLVVMLLAAVALFGAVTTAEAGAVTNWYGIQPVGTVGAGLPITIQGNGAYNAYPLLPASAKLYVDGVAIPRASFTASILRTTVYFYCSPATKLADGPHTFRVEVSDSAGIVSSRTWGAVVAQPPTASWVAPLAGSALRDGRPAIVMSLADNTPGALSVAGQVRTGSGAGPVSATFGGTGLAAGSNTFTLPSELAPGTYYLTATVTDAAGYTCVLQGAAARSFTTVATPAMTVLESCDGCHPTYRTAHPTPGSTDCMVCHPGYDGDHMEGTDYCEDCHWQGWHNGGSGATAAVTSACTVCHSASRPEIVRHTAASAGPGHMSSCDGCHNESLVTRHAATPAGSSYPNQCGLCHESTLARVRAAISGADATCDACHDAAPGHGFDPALHTATGTSCVADGCHPTNLLVDAHTPYVGAGKRYPQYADACALCHANEVPTRIPAGATADCATCHPDRVTPHGYDASKHLSNETCLLACHQAELKPEHDSHAGPVACTYCHPTKADPVKPWSATCSACHPVIAHASASHQGTDAAVRVSRSGGGCSDTPPDQTNCHVISDLSALHFDMPGHGCAVCHGEGKTPTRECRTCHPQEDPKTYESYVTTFYPSGDGPVVGTTTSSAGATRWDTVDEPNPGDADATYFQFTTPGSAMFTSIRSIPVTATIQSVVIYARARTGSATTRNYYPMVTVGGTSYQRTPVLIGATYSGGAGLAYTLTTNPKTGMPWRPDELNSTGSTSSLDYFGVGSGNASGVANQWLRVTQCYAVVTYTLPIELPPGTLLGGSWYHHNNNKYLFDTADIVPGSYYFPDAWPAHGWNDALFYQECYDFCHSSYSPSPVFTAQQGTWMWYSTAGAYFPETRNLTLATITVPADAPALDFTTNWRMGGTDTGYVEVSSDGGASYVPLTGVVDGVSMSSITSNTTTWVPAHYDLSAYAGQAVRIRFRFVVNDGAAGWAFDELSITGSGVTVFSDDAETLKPEWENYHWTRSHGAYPY